MTRRPSGDASSFTQESIGAEITLRAQTAPLSALGFRYRSDMTELTLSASLANQENRQQVDTVTTAMDLSRPPTSLCLQTGTL